MSFKMNFKMKLKMSFCISFGGLCVCITQSSLEIYWPAKLCAFDKQARTQRDRWEIDHLTKTF